MSNHWFLVASQRQVKIICETTRKSRFEVIKILKNPLARIKNRRLVRKQAGMGIRQVGQRGVARYTYLKRKDPHEQAAIQFAKKIADYLNNEMGKHHFCSLTILAEPHFIGKIRSALNPKIKKLVVNWIKKDVEKKPDSEMVQFLLPHKNHSNSSHLSLSPTSNGFYEKSKYSYGKGLQRYVNLKKGPS